MSYPISVTLTISEIANGVLVTVGGDEVGFYPRSRGTYFESIDAACSTLDDLVMLAWDEARRHAADRDRYAAGSLVSKMKASSPFAEQADRLPEEAAVQPDAERAPIVDEDNGYGDAMIRTDPVMRTKGFEVPLELDRPLYPDAD